MLTAQDGMIHQADGTWMQQTGLRLNDKQEDKEGKGKVS